MPEGGFKIRAWGAERRAEGKGQRAKGREQRAESSGDVTGVATTEKPVPGFSHETIDAVAEEPREYHESVKQLPATAKNPEYHKGGI